MKWFLLASIGLSAIGFADAVSIQVKKNSLGEPFYRSISQLRLEAENPLTGNVSIKFQGKNDIILEMRENLKIRKNDFEGCSDSYCVNILELPLSLEKYTCFIDFKVTLPNGELLLNRKENWGDCLTSPPLPDRKYLSDLAFPEDAYFSDEGAIEIQNLGYRLLNKIITVWGFLKNKNGEIIWTGHYSSEISIENQQVTKIQFQDKPESWHEHLACNGVFYLDPEFQLFEKTKLNNRIEVDFGNCEEAPSESRGDMIDFLPEVKIENGVLFLSVRNNGRLPYIEETTKIQSYVRYFDRSGDLIFMRDIFTGPKVHGFGSVKKIIQDNVPPGTCSVGIEINPNLIIRESSYINNRIELNICE